jgi:methyl-accepting chemotaxis protein
VNQHHQIFVEPELAALPAYTQFWTELREGKAQQGEFKRIGKGGVEVWLSAIYAPVLGPDGQISKIIKLARDVTQEKLRTADFEGQIAAIGRSQAVVTYTTQGVVLGANYSRESVLGKSHSVFLTNEDAVELDAQEFWATLRAGKAMQEEFKFVKSKGTFIWFHASFTPIFGPSGRQVVKIVSFAQDVTAEKLRNADFEGQIAAIGQTQAVVSFTPKGVVMAANNIFLRSMGYREDELVGRHHRLLVDDHGSLEEFWMDLREGKAQLGEFKQWPKTRERCGSGQHTPRFESRRGA